ncbi:MAG: polysaccharide deacetylase [uncultured bacterium]|nr:MAG: polysaccharide deacetylase [uncultured bacterium]
MNSLDIKRRLGYYWPARQQNRKIILLYHSVGDTTWAMSEYDFSIQMDWLADHCKILSLTDLIHSEPSEDLQVAITFDDGYRTLHHYVAPILVKKNMSGMVYLNTGWISDTDNQRKLSVPELGHYPDESFLTWQEVKELHQMSWEIGSHGANHYDFSKLSEDMVKQELSQSKHDIEDNLKIPCTHFSYPWGKYSAYTKKIVKQVGYQYAVAARHNKISINSDWLALPRMNISRDYSFNDFKNIVKGKWDYLGILHQLKGL